MVSFQTALEVNKKMTKLFVYRRTLECLMTKKFNLILNIGDVKASKTELLSVLLFFYSVVDSTTEVAEKSLLC